MDILKQIIAGLFCLCIGAFVIFFIVGVCGAHDNQVKRTKELVQDWRRGQMHVDHMDEDGTIYFVGKETDDHKAVQVEAHMFVH